MAQRELSDAEVFGSSDAEVFGTTAAQPQRSASESAEQPLPGRPAPPPSPVPRPYYRGAGRGRQLPPPDAQAPVPLQRIGEAIATGWQGGTMQSPSAYEQTQQTALGRYLVNPLLQLGALPFRALGAFGAGTGQVAYETGVALGGPEMGRDLYMLNQIMPALPASPLYSTIGRNRLLQAPEGPPSPGRFASEIPAHPSEPQPVWRPVAPGEEPVYGREYRMNQNTGQREVNVGGPVVQQRGPVQGVPEPEPPPPVTSADVAQGPAIAQPSGALPSERGGSVGAAQTINPPQMDPAEFRASRFDGELKRLMTGPEQGDATEYVPGVRPTKAEIELQPSVSREAKGLRQEFREGFNEKEKEDNRIYYDTFDELAGTKTQLDKLERARSAQAEKDLKAAGLTPESTRPPVNAQKVVDKIDEILADPRLGESEDVKRYLKPIRDQLFDENGKLKDDPLRLYGIREGVVKKLSKASKAETPTVGNVEGQLLEIRDVLDGVIEQGASGYAQYRKNYATASQEIDYKSRLQDAKTQLTNGPDRVFTFSKFDRLMKDLIGERGEAGLPQPAHHIPDDVMERLYGIHRSLQRSASDQELAKTRGSDTTQMLGELGRQGLAQGIASIVPVPGAHVVAPFLAKQLGGVFTQRRLEKHLNPDVTPYQNRLLGP